jgi:chloramphenicol 3-O phosphotransferase
VRENGWVVILNGAPRSGKSSIVRAMQADPARSWMNLGVDVVLSMTPPHIRPGIGLRPGGERPDLEGHVAATFGWMYDAIAGMSRRGLDVIVDVGHHDAYSRPIGTLVGAARRLIGIPALLVGVRCPIEVVMERRDGGSEPGRRYLGSGAGGEIPEPVRRWQTEVHRPGVYDLEVDTSAMTPEVCAQQIEARISEGAEPTALAALRTGWAG